PAPGSDPTGATSAPRVRAEEPEVHRLAHRPVAGCVEMQVVPVVVLGAEPAGSGGIANGGVEVDDPVQLTRAANPRLHRLSDELLVRREVTSGGTLEGQERAPVDLHSRGMRPGNELPVPPDELLGRHPRRLGLHRARVAEVVDSLEDDDPANPRLVEG